MAAGAAIQLLTVDQVQEMKKDILAEIRKGFEELKNSTVEKPLPKNEFAKKHLGLTPSGFNKMIKRGDFPIELISKGRILPSRYNEWLQTKQKKS